MGSKHRWERQAGRRGQAAARRANSRPTWRASRSSRLWSGCRRLRAKALVSSWISHRRERGRPPRRARWTRADPRPHQSRLPAQLQPAATTRRARWTRSAPTPHQSQLPEQLQPAATTRRARWTRSAPTPNQSRRLAPTARQSQLPEQLQPAVTTRRARWTRAAPTPHQSRLGWTAALQLACIFGISRLYFTCTCIPPVSYRILGIPIPVYPCIDLY